MIKKTLFLALSTTLFLVACGDKDEATNIPNNAPVDQSNSNTTTNTTDTPFNFTHFNLEVDYANNQSYDVSYENESSGAEAKIDDEVNNKVIEGNEAMNTLLPIFESFTFDSTTSNDLVILEVLQKFSIENDYLEVEIEVKFADGTKKKYHSMN